MEIRTLVTLIKCNFEHLLACFEEQQRLQQLDTFLLKDRVVDILEGAIAELLAEEDIDCDNIRWLQEAITTFMRYFPENLSSSHVPFLDAEIDQLYTNIIRLHHELMTCN